MLRINLTALLDLLIVLLFAQLLNGTARMVAETEQAREGQREAQENQVATDALLEELREIKQRQLIQLQEAKVREEDLRRELLEAKSLADAGREQAVEQQELSNAAISALLDSRLPNPEQREQIREVLQHVNEPAMRQQVKAILEQMPDDSDGMNRAIAKQFALAMTVRRVCDIWELQVTSRSAVVLRFNSSEIDRRAFSLDSPHRDLVVFVLSAVRRNRAPSNRPAIFWIEYAGTDELLYGTRLFLKQVIDELALDLKTEFGTEQKLVIADQL